MEKSELLVEIALLLDQYECKNDSLERIVGCEIDFVEERKSYSYNGKWFVEIPWTIEEL